MATKKTAKKAPAPKKSSAKKPASKKKAVAKKATGDVSTTPAVKQETTVVYANDIKQKSLRDRFLAWFKS